MRHSRIKTKF